MGNKSSNMRKKCTICGHGLSIHNRATVCFHHPEHPDESTRRVCYRSMPVRGSTGGPCGNLAWKTQIDENGGYYV